MVNIEKQIQYWETGAVEDWQVAVELVEMGRTRHGLFFAHLALEKLLKALVCRATQDLAPRMHALLRLSECAGVDFSEPQRVFLARFDRYQMEGRYPDALPVPLDIAAARTELQQAQEMFAWLHQKLSE